jgi:hypothetical protein
MLTEGVLATPLSSTARIALDELYGLRHAAGL